MSNPKTTTPNLTSARRTEDKVKELMDRAARRKFKIHELREAKARKAGVVR